MCACVRVCDVYIYIHAYGFPDPEEFCEPRVYKCILQLQTHVDSMCICATTSEKMRLGPAVKAM